MMFSECFQWYVDDDGKGDEDDDDDDDGDDAGLDGDVDGGGEWWRWR